MGGGGVQYDGSQSRAKECGALPPCVWIVAISDDCSVHARRQSLRGTDRSSGGELEPEGEGTRRLPHVN